MEKEMTVFGFGRKRIEKFLDSVPQPVSVRLLQTDDLAEIAAVMERMGGRPASSQALVPEP
jgi:hypothetical protein